MNKTIITDNLLGITFLLCTVIFVVIFSIHAYEVSLVEDNFKNADCDQKLILLSTLKNDLTGSLGLYLTSDSYFKSFIFDYKINCYIVNTEFNDTQQEIDELRDLITELYKNLDF